jgi:hypothetical protein
MSDYVKCSICKEYGWKDTHQCQPSWDIIRADYHDEDDPQRSYGYDAESAVIKFAEDNFSNWEYPNSIEIWIRVSEDDEWQKFEVEVESVPSFSAYRKE